uniref:Bacteriophage lambda head decoration protein D n=1 Tax=Candidatus Kentrum sp. LPFa TaxID=2126335 RepID=A0A450WZU1_9GAMM|nr:MAG: Bacteriophage lambda head decoration protein D [Candidatus Kentron sp. LPFa]
MPTYIEPKNLEDLIAHEVQRPWTRDGKLFLTGKAYAVGEVLSLVEGKLQAFDPAGAGDAGVAHAISIEAVNATEDDKRGVAIARGAVLYEDELIWPDAITDEQKAAAIKQLEARGIKLVDSA